MIEANEDISLVVEQQTRDLRESRQQYQDVLEGRTVHPAMLMQQMVVTNATTLEVIPSPQNEEAPSGTPAAPLGTVPLAFKLALGVGFIVACLLIRHWLMQRESD